MNKSFTVTVSNHGAARITGPADLEYIAKRLRFIVAQLEAGEGLQDGTEDLAS